MTFYTNPPCPDCGSPVVVHGNQKLANGVRRQRLFCKDCPYHATLDTLPSGKRLAPVRKERPVKVQKAPAFREDAPVPWFCTLPSRRCVSVRT
jgi:transposase-like protein